MGKDICFALSLAGWLAIGALVAVYIWVLYVPK
jgi:hypothetical protein